MNEAANAIHAGAAPAPTAPERPRASPWGGVWLVVRVAVAAGLLVALWASGRLGLGHLARLEASWSLAALVGLVGGSLLLPVWRWWLLLRVQGIPEPVGRTLWMTWAGYFGALFLPGGAGGDLAKGYLAVLQRPGARARAVSTILADRALGLYSLLLLGVVAIWWLPAAGGGLFWLAASVAALWAGATAGAVGMLLPGVRGVAFGFLPRAWREAWDDSFARYAAAPGALAACLAISLASNALVLLSFCVAAGALGESVPVEAGFLAGPLVVLANCLPLSPGGVGVGETTAEALFAMFGGTGGAAAVLLTRAVGVAAALPGVLPVLAPRPAWGQQEGGHESQRPDAA